jgi:hypothetical protein
MAQKLKELMPGKILRRKRPQLKLLNAVIRPRVYLIPPLEECRAAFLEAMRITTTYNWPEENEK